MIAILTFAVFSLFALSQPDMNMITGGGTVKVPFAGIEVTFLLFLAIGPATMLVLTIYLHLFVGHRGRWFQIPNDKRLPFIFNQSSVLAKVVSFSLFYLVPVITFWAYAWKALPVNAAALMIAAAFLVTSGLIILLIRRCTYWWRPFAIPALALLVAGILAFGAVDAACRYGWVERPERGVCVPCNRLLSRGYVLEGSDLKGLSIPSVSLTYANLQRAQLQGANLERTRIDCAVGREASFRDANLSGASLRGSQFAFANFRGANLDGADLSDSDFSSADLTAAKFGNCKAARANFAGYKDAITQLSNCDIDRADLSGAEFSYLYLGVHTTNYQVASNDLGRYNQWIAPIPCEGDKCTQEIAPDWEPKFTYDQNKYRLERFDDGGISQFCSGKETANITDDYNLYLVRNRGHEVDGKFLDRDYEKINNADFPKGFKELVCGPKPATLRAIRKKAEPRRK
jgi:hypothetical protein